MATMQLLIHTAPAAGAAALSPDGTRRLRLAFCLNALLFLWLLAHPARHSLVAAVDNIAECLGPLLGAAWCFRPGRPRGGVRAPARLLLGLGALAYAVGQSIWTYYELVLHRDCPFPSWADAGFLAAYPFLFAGILGLPARRLPLALRGRVFLDGLMTMTALVTFSWYFLLGPTLLKGAESRLGMILGAAYPLGDVVVLFCLLVLAAHPGEDRLRRAVPVLSLGLLAIIVGDIVFGYQTLHNTYATGCLADVGWPLGYMLVAVAACEVGGQAEAERADAPQNPVLWRSLLPYALVPAVVALLVYTLTHRGDEKLEPGVYVGSAVLIGLVLLRQVFALLENNRLNRYLRDAYAELEEKNRLLEALATTDGMTGLANHRVFQERLRRELAAVPESGLSVLLLDVDHFKQYNDAFGHPAGDGVLKAVAALLRRSVPGGLAARYGGEEFAVLLPGTSGEEAQRAAEDIRAAVAAQEFPNRAVTLSIGLAHSGYCGADPEGLISEADAALYAAKRAGRNRVRVAAPRAAAERAA